MQNTIIRDIPIFDDWLIDGKNIYKAKDVDEFEEKIKLFFDGKLPNLTKQSYEVAKQRNINVIGKKLKMVYDEVSTLK